MAHLNTRANNIAKQSKTDFPDSKAADLACNNAVIRSTTQKLWMANEGQNLYAKISANFCSYIFKGEKCNEILSIFKKLLEYRKVWKWLHTKLIQSSTRKQHDEARQGWAPERMWKCWTENRLLHHKNRKGVFEDGLSRLKKKETASEIIASSQAIL